MNLSGITSFVVLMSLPSGNLRWIANYLTSRTRHVVGEGEMLAAANVLSDVPQGSLLGPRLFLIYIRVDGISANPLVHESNPSDLCR